MNQMYKIMFIIPRTAFYNQTKSRINSPSYHWLKWDHKWPLIDVRPDLLVVWSVLSISYLCSLDILLSACVRYSSASVIFCCNVYFQDVNVMIVCAMCMVRKEQFIFLSDNFTIVLPKLDYHDWRNELASPTVSL